MKRAQHVKTVAQVREEFSRIGKPFTEWAREHGYGESLVYEILRGRIKGNRGKSHEIKVLLGLKAGEIQPRRPA